MSENTEMQTPAGDTEQEEMSPGVAYAIKKSKELEQRVVHLKIENEKYQFVACSPKVIDYARQAGFTGPVGPEMLDFTIDHLQARARSGAPERAPGQASEARQIVLDDADVDELVTLAKTLLGRFETHTVTGEGAPLVAQTMGFLYQRIVEGKSDNSDSVSGTQEAVNKVIQDLQRVSESLSQAAGS